MTRSFIVGQDRNEPGWVAHIYEVIGDRYVPMCLRGWNRNDGYGISIFRGNSGEAGVCEVCKRRMLEDRPAVESRERKTKWL
jgi:hypothetical protein